MWCSVSGEKRGFARKSAVGFPAYETNVKVRNVERIRTGML